MRQRTPRPEGRARLRTRCTGSPQLVQLQQPVNSRVLAASEARDDLQGRVCPSVHSLLPCFFKDMRWLINLTQISETKGMGSQGFLCR